MAVYQINQGPMLLCLSIPLFSMDRSGKGFIDRPIALKQTRPQSALADAEIFAPLLHVFTLAGRGR